MTSRRQVLGGFAALLPVPALLGCQASPAATAARPVVYTAPGGIGAVLFDAAITQRTRELLMLAIRNMADAGATTIRLGINSPGGEVDAAQELVRDMDAIRAARRVTFETYAVGLVASAATYVFLNGQRRFARNGSGFLFHAAGLVSNGAVSAERLREEAGKIDAYEQAVRRVLKARTRLTDAAIDVYLHRTVILTADDALRDGVIEAVAGFAAAPGGQVVVVGARRAPAAPAGAQGGAPGNGPMGGR